MVKNAELTLKFFTKSQIVTLSVSLSKMKSQNDLLPFPHLLIAVGSTKRPIFEMTNLNGQIIKRFELESTSGNLKLI